MLLHHAWHRDTRNHEWDGKYYSAQFKNLDIELQETLADWAVDVAGRLTDNAIPYGVFYNLKANFGSDGKYIDRGDANGHTCATFLLDIFCSYGLPLLDLWSWPQDREGDRQWIQKMLGYMVDHNVLTPAEAGAQYFSKIRRFRPEEVAAAATLYVDAPLNFEAVQEHSQAIADQIRLL